MSFLRAVFAGLAEGITALLPVSSAGIIHAFRLAGGENAALWDGILLVPGAALAVFIRMRRRLMRGIGSLVGGMLKRPVSGTDRKRTFLFLICFAASIPVMILLAGLRERFGGSYLAEGAGFLVTAVLLTVCGLMSVRGGNSVEHPFRRAAFSGIAFGCGILPGFSGVAGVYSALRISGFARRNAAAMTCLMRAFGGIVWFVLVLARAGGRTIPWGMFLIGNVVSLAAGYFAFPAAKKILTRVQPGFFAVINALIGILLVVLYLLAS